MPKDTSVWDYDYGRSTYWTVKSRMNTTSATSATTATETYYWTDHGLMEKIRGFKDHVGSRLKRVRRLGGQFYLEFEWGWELYCINDDKWLSRDEIREGQIFDLIDARMKRSRARHYERMKPVRAALDRLNRGHEHPNPKDEIYEEEQKRYNEQMKRIRY